MKERLIHFKNNRRQRVLFAILLSIILLSGLIISGLLIGNEKIGVHLHQQNHRPSFTHPFGTDWLGRDMFARTLKGLTLSFSLGLLTAFLSTTIALVLSLRSEEHTSELQSRGHLVCRLLL